MRLGSPPSPSGRGNEGEGPHPDLSPASGRGGFCNIGAEARKRALIMIGLLILAEKHLGAGLIATVVHTLGSRPPQLQATELDHSAPPEQIESLLEHDLKTVDQGEGVLILADVYGATHTNIACRHLVRGRIELITGVNLPMLLRVLNYRQLKMDDLIDKALSGGCGGIICAANPGNAREAK